MQTKEHAVHFVFTLCDIHIFSGMKKVGNPVRLTATVNSPLNLVR